MASTALPTISSEGNLSRYLQEIRRFPMLAPEEEYMLAKRWREHALLFRRQHGEATDLLEIPRQVSFGRDGRQGSRHRHAAPRRSSTRASLATRRDVTHNFRAREVFCLI